MKEDVIVQKLNEKESIANEEIKQTKSLLGDFNSKFGKALNTKVSNFNNSNNSTRFKLLIEYENCLEY